MSAPLEDTGPVTNEMRRAVRDLFEAAMSWNEHDYGDPGELHADATLSDAVRAFQAAAERAGVSPRDAVTSWLSS